MSYQHAEAFCLMRYAAVESDGLLVIWNSRDGVTPFGFSRDGKEYRHVEWNRDRCVPDHKLYPGDLFWRDQTLEDAQAIATRKAREFWAEPIGGERARYASEDELRSVILDDLCSRPGSPFLDVYAEPEVSK